MSLLLLFHPGISGGPPPPPPVVVSAPAAGEGAGGAVWGALDWEARRKKRHQLVIDAVKAIAVKLMG